MSSVQKHRRTVGTFCCPACGEIRRMLVVSPFWHCVACNVRLIPADDPDPSPFRRQTISRLASARFAEIEHDAPVWVI